MTPVICLLCVSSHHTDIFCAVSKTTNENDLFICKWFRLLCIYTAYLQRSTDVQTLIMC